MTLEMYAAVAASERGGRIEQIPASDDRHARPPAVAQDLIPRLSAMRRMIGAESFAVFACPAVGAIAGGALSLVLDDRADEGEGVQPRLAAGRVLLAHIERSALPLAWGRAEGNGSAAGKKRHGLARAVLPGVTSTGIAFPVRLGAIGNGIILFEGEEINLGAALLFTLHRLAYRVMADLFKLEMSKAAPRQSLSERELECLQWAGDGCKSEAIADKLGLSVHTVNAYLGSATAKLDSVNRIQAIAKAIRLGFIA